MDHEQSQEERPEQELLYKALGALLLIKDKFSDQFDELYRQANASKEEMERTIDETQKRAQEHKEQMEEQLRSKIRSVVEEMGLATKEDIEELKEMIRELKKG